MKLSILSRLLLLYNKLILKRGYRKQKNLTLTVQYSCGNAHKMKMISGTMSGDISAKNLDSCTKKLMSVGISTRATLLS